MMWNDLINGLFELFGCVAIGLNVRRIYHDKQVKGVSVWAMIFFTSWGAWNCYYYPSLDQWWSFYGAFATFFTNGIWLYLYVYYRFVYRKETRIWPSIHPVLAEHRGTRSINLW